ncbi:MAG: type II secretion system GspH family protein [Candidatus Peregrinibacteria bacterium]|nr:type II secretion system GspH family protein [Candidatus Peregrinibacteria bacterium]
MEKFLNLNFQKIKPRRKVEGISLIEVLVSIVISGIVFSAVMVSYFSLIQTQKKADLMRQLQKEVHFAIIRIADKIRANSIDYSAYSEGSCSAVDLRSSLKLCIGDGNVFELNGDRLLMNEAPLISQKFSINKLFFYSSPTSNPAENKGDPSIQFQPKVTIYLEVESQLDPSIKMEVQTTISSRNYK